MARILMVEDDQMLRKQYALYLRSRDGGTHEVDEAGSATKAVELIGQNAYDLVLLDIMLAYGPDDERNKEIVAQEVDYGRKMGLYVYKRIRALPRPLPIVLVSVVDDYGILSEFPDVMERLPKYFPLEDLGTTVRKCLAGK